ncbi:MAG: MBOAT family protein [Oscillospiraceae bacterium]|jgi:alginate O-acetyltransferase complex protein AlgI|nr:MBOAT family protein [Oscillospiraceae bacterium]
MVFSSLLFIFVYLPAVLLGYYGIPFAARKIKPLTKVKFLNSITFRNVWLFAVDFIFYGWGEPKYIVLMLCSITLNYVAGLLIHKYISNRKTARLILIINVLLNLAMLAFFKYTDLIITTFGGKAVGIELPIGISFYTFQTMSYPIDLYRGECEEQRSFVKFGTFVALFPQLIAGPIVRYKDIADQLDERSETLEKFSSGVQRFVIGLVKKVLLANNIGVLWDWYKAVPTSELSVLGAWLGLIAFSFQIYFDFSGYSDMAVGLGRMLGFEFLENFNYPYISKSITEFWRRWHISLSTWFRDYVYIPLGGNRKGISRQLVNIGIVWALTGLWHGASWNFLFWGIYYAILLILEKVFLLRWLEKIPAVFSRIYTLLLVALGWALFAIEDLSVLPGYVAALFGANQLISPDALYWLRNYGVSLVILTLSAAPFLTNQAAKLSELRPKLVEYARPALILLALIICTAQLVDNTYNPFLYFKF